MSEDTEVVEIISTESIQRSLEPEESFEGPDAAHAAGRERSRKRGQSPPTIEYKRADTDTEPRTMRQAAADLALTRRARNVEKLTAAGVPQDAALDAVTNDSPTEVVAADPDKEDLSVREAARALQAFRAGELERQTFEAIVGDEPQTGTQPTEQLPEQGEQAPESHVDQEWQKAHQAVVQLEQAAAFHMSRVDEFGNREFADIRTADDVERMQAHDPARFAKFQSLVNERRLAHDQMGRMQQQRVAEERREFESYAKAQDDHFNRITPEAKNPEKMRALQEAAVEMFQRYGISGQELAALHHGDPRFRSAIMQSIIADAARLHLGQQAVRNATAAPKPPVQRPGSSHVQSRLSPHEGNLQGLDARLGRTGSVKDAARLVLARRAAAAARR